MDKWTARRVAAHEGVPTARLRVLHATEFARDPARCLASVGEALGYPCFVKPNSLGSSVGCDVAVSENALAGLLPGLFRLDERVLVEEVLDGSDLSYAFVGSPDDGLISRVGREIASQGGFELTLASKHIARNPRLSVHLPARLSDEENAQVRGWVARLVRVFGLSGLARIDFLLCRRTRRVVFNEVNTMPGLDSGSFSGLLRHAEGLEPWAWIERAITLAFARSRAARERVEASIAWTTPAFRELFER